MSDLPPDDPNGPNGADNDDAPYESLINYEELLQNALRTLMREALRDVSAVGELPGEHHFYIGFWTRHAGVEISDRLLAQYDEQMVIVLQHQFDALTVEEISSRSPAFWRNPRNAGRALSGRVPL